MSAVLWPVTARIVTALNAANGVSEHETAMRLLKVTEEAGEAAAAYIGMTGQNPRKGTTHTRNDVADELCDVIIAAAVALHAFNPHPPAVLDAKLRAAARRLANASTPTPQAAYAHAPDIPSELTWLTTRYAGREPDANTAPEDARLWRLRHAATLDRIALQPQNNDLAHIETADDAAEDLLLHDDIHHTGYYTAAAESDPRDYVRQQYQIWRTQDRHSALATPAPECSDAGKGS